MNPLLSIREAIQSDVHVPERGGNVILPALDVRLRLIVCGNAVDDEGG